MRNENDIYYLWLYERFCPICKLLTVEINGLAKCSFCGYSNLAEKHKKFIKDRLKKQKILDKL